MADLVVCRFDDGSECRVRADDDPPRLIPKLQSSLLPDDVRPRTYSGGSRLPPVLPHFDDLSGSLNREQEITPYFPGLQVRAASGFVFRNAKWLKGSWKGRNAAKPPPPPPLSAHSCHHATVASLLKPPLL